MMGDFMYRQAAVDQRAPPPQPGRAAHDSQSTASQAPAVAGGAAAPVAPGQNALAPTTPGAVPALDNSPRLKIEAERIHGSVRLRGARIDDLILDDYRSSLEENSDKIVLLSAAGTQFSYYAEFGWALGAGEPGTGRPESGTGRDAELKGSELYASGCGDCSY